MTDTTLSRLEWLPQQATPEYKIVDLWELNAQYFSQQKKPSNNDTLEESHQEMTESRHDVTSKVSLRGHKEEPFKKNPEEEPNTATPSVAEKEVAEIIYSFKEVNPAYRKMFSQPAQREAVKNLLKAYGFEELKKKVERLKDIIVMPYAPRVTTPYMLEMKMGDLTAFINQERNKTKSKQTWTAI